MATSRHRPPLVTIGPGDLALCGTPSSQIVHLMIRSPGTRCWAATAACGNAGWRQHQLDAEIPFALRLDGIHPSRRCARAFCANLWPVYDQRAG